MSNSKYLEVTTLKTVLAFFPNIMYSNSCLADLQDAVLPTAALRLYNSRHYFNLREPLDQRLVFRAETLDELGFPNKR